MHIHCPTCGYEGKQGVLNMVLTLLARVHGQTNVTCPKCGFHRAFTRTEWKNVRR